jgi:hypothetical protein
MASAAAAGAHVCDVCDEPAVVYRFDGDTDTLLCARHLLISDPPAGEAYARVALPPDKVN